jgi:hypothetical protein
MSSVNFTCPYCDEHLNELSLDKEKKLAQFSVWIRQEYDRCIEDFLAPGKDYLFLNEDILQFAVGSCIEDLTRYTTFSNSEQPDRHKVSAYLMKWLSIAKPIQTNNIEEGVLSDSNSQLVFDANYTFALRIGLAWLGLNKDTFHYCPPNYFNFLKYSLKFRRVSGRMLAGDLYLLEQMIDLEKKKSAAEKSKLSRLKNTILK